MVLFDSAFLLLLLDPRANIPRDPKSNKAIVKGRERVEHLIDMLSDARTRVLVPAPVLAEVLVHAGAATQQYVSKIRSISSMQVAEFDTLAAIECAQLTSAAIKTGKKRGGAGNEPWQKVKIDRQIVAIAKVHQVQIIYTCDGGLSSTARLEGFQVMHVADLPMPPLKNQTDLFPG